MSACVLSLLSTKPFDSSTAPSGVSQLLLEYSCTHPVHAFNFKRYKREGSGGN